MEFEPEPSRFLENNNNALDVNNDDLLEEEEGAAAAGNWENQPLTVTTWSKQQQRPRRTFASRHRRAATSVTVSSSYNNSHNEGHDNSSNKAKALSAAAPLEGVDENVENANSGVPQQSQSKQALSVQQQQQKRNFGRSYSLGTTSFSNSQSSVTTASVTSFSSSSSSSLHRTPFAAPLSPSVPPPRREPLYRQQSLRNVDNSTNNNTKASPARPRQRRRRSLIQEMSTSSVTLPVASSSSLFAEDHRESVDTPPIPRRPLVPAMATTSPVASPFQSQPHYRNGTTELMGSHSSSNNSNRRRRMLAHQSKSQTLPPLGPSSAMNSFLHPLGNNSNTKPSSSSQMRLPSPPAPRFTRSFSLGAPSLSSSNTRQPYRGGIEPGDGEEDDLDFLLQGANRQQSQPQKPMLSPRSPPLRRSWTASSNPFALDAAGGSENPHVWNAEDEFETDPTSRRRRGNDKITDSSAAAVEVPLERGRKKMRARRASIQGAIPSLSELQKRQSRSPMRGCCPPIPPRMTSNMPRSLSCTSSPCTTGGDPRRTTSSEMSVSDVLSGTGAVATGGSPSNLSRTSSGRKRMVCGSPIVDWMASDDLSSSQTGLSVSMNSCGSSLSVRRRSKSRIFSPPTTPSAPPPPLKNLNLTIAAGEAAPPPLSSQSQWKPLAANDTGGDPDLEWRGIDGAVSSSDDDDDSDDDSRTLRPQDVSISDMNIDDCHHHPVPVITISTDTATSTADLGAHPISTDAAGGEVVVMGQDPCHDILMHMPSFADLKFLVQELHNESKRNMTLFVGRGGHGNGASWTIPLPKEWHSHRRSAFIHWSVQHLRFALRPLGDAVNVLKISKTQGPVLLERLEKAMGVYKKQQQDGCGSGVSLKQHNNFPETPFPPFSGGPKSSVFDHSTAPATTPWTVPQGDGTTPMANLSISSPPTIVHQQKTSSFGALLEKEDDVDLAANLQSLSLNQQKKMTTTNNTNRQSDVSLQVGSDFVETVDVGNLRPSLGHSVVASNALMMHIHGDHDDDDDNEQEDEDVEVVYDMGDNLLDSSSRLRLRRNISTGCDSVEELGKMPKLSISSANTVTTGGRLSAPYAPIQNLDVFETPQIKPDEGWGSRPIPGKDWGVSTAFEKAASDELMERFETAVQTAGVRESTGGLPVMPGGLEMEEDEEEIVTDVVMSEQQENRVARRRTEVSIAKRHRMSLWARASQNGGPVALPFANRRRTTNIDLTSSKDTEVALLQHEYKDSFPTDELYSECTSWKQEDQDHSQVLADETILVKIFSFLSESDLWLRKSLVCSTWASAVTTAHAEYMMASVGYYNAMTDESYNEEEEEEEDELLGESLHKQDDALTTHCAQKINNKMDRSWEYLLTTFPWGCFLSSGAFKKVFKVYNTWAKGEEAVSVMDVEKIVDKKTIATELVVSAMLSAISRRGICPNFLIIHGVFTLPYDVPESRWGSEDVKRPNGSRYSETRKLGRTPPEPKCSNPGRYQLIRMELCSDGDFEEYLKRQEAECLSGEVARASLFQIAFALHAAAERCSLKHYDIKLLNVFLQEIKPPNDSRNVTLRYGLGSHVFALRLSSSNAFFAKLADYGTANIQSESTGKPVTIAQYTTLENTPPEFMILGDNAKQGHWHDNFGLGLCMLHLFTGHAPYEEIMEDVTCPPLLKKKLSKLWENESISEYSVIRSVVLSEVYKDERGHMVEGDPDDTLYNTLYRFLVLFGIPDDRYEQRKFPKVWKAISEALEGKATGRRKQGTDAAKFDKDRQKYSIEFGTNMYIARARRTLNAMPGGMNLLYQLCSFNPETRATALQVLNSEFMEPLREREGTNAEDYAGDMVLSYTAFSTCNHPSFR